MLVAMAGLPGAGKSTLAACLEKELGAVVLDKDRGHPAGNRTFDLYLSLKVAAESITIPHFTLDTGKTPLEECVRRCLAYLGCGTTGTS
jgi:hypothetical protein